MELERGRVERRRKRVWVWVLLCIVWLIWLEWNRWTFDDVWELVVRIKVKFLAVLLFWELGTSSPDACLFLEFLDTLVG